ncbi:hypothetical protein STEG23_017965, partial [Scotinomys teguina]
LLSGKNLSQSFIRACAWFIPDIQGVNFESYLKEKAEVLWCRPPGFLSHRNQKAEMKEVTMGGGETRFHDITRVYFGGIIYLFVTETLEEVDIDYIFPETLEEVDIDDIFTETLEEVDIDDIFTETLEEVDIDDIFTETLEEVDIDYIFTETLEEVDIDDIFPGREFQPHHFVYVFAYFISSCFELNLVISSHVY